MSFLLGYNDEPSVYAGQRRRNKHPFSSSDASNNRARGVCRLAGLIRRRGSRILHTQDSDVVLAPTESALPAAQLLHDHTRYKKRARSKTTIHTYPQPQNGVPRRYLVSATYIYVPSRPRAAPDTNACARISRTATTPRREPHRLRRRLLAVDRLRPLAPVRISDGISTARGARHSVPMFPAPTTCTRLLPMVRANLTRRIDGSQAHALPVADAHPKQRTHDGPRHCTLRAPVALLVGRTIHPKRRLPTTYPVIHPLILLSADSCIYTREENDPYDWTGVGVARCLF
ncbi:hypothetical protein C8J57DRAFT_1519120 [Mycena rebaudengoi]|nr:hypothetical protein C8J57DRAFT_1519120 [Mycena rebaudengoi]